MSERVGMKVSACDVFAALFFRNGRRFATVGAAVVGLLVCAGWQSAQAIPSFARQTGLECNACHTAYPQLNAFGREFKANGYSFGGGDSGWMPPVAFMGQASLTHTAKSQPGGAAPHFKGNDNFALSQASLFYGGKIYDTLGAFSQLTYSGVDRRLAIDNTDIRWSGTGQIAGKDAVFGITVDNNPTVEDLWNSTPAWGFPFASSDLTPSPAASTLIDGGLAGQVAGVGGYMRWNNLLYADVTGYRTLPRGAQTTLGVSPEGEDEISGTAPYWRLAVQHAWGNSYLAAGTFGLVANTYPGRDHSAGTDRKRDIGFDAQYQYSADKNDVTMLLRWINERASFDASVPLGNVDNSHDTLNSVSATVSYLYDKTYGLDLGFLSTTGTTDATRYGSRTGSPDTDRFTVQLDYLPFNRDGGPSAWKWFNPKFILQYTAYRKFNGSRSNYDGSGRDAADNDTVYLMAWLPF